MRIVPQSFEILAHTPDPELLIERIARVSYKSEDKIAPGSAKPLIERLIKSAHDSVLEHASVTVLLVTDRGVTHELVRHRIASFTQESTRYCNYGSGRFEGGITVIDPAADLNSEVRDAWRRSVQGAEEAYLRLTRLGVKPQIARAVLPTSLKAEIAITANVREWRHILKLRCAPDAHPQMRELMCKVRDEFISRWPLLFQGV